MISTLILIRSIAASSEVVLEVLLPVLLSCHIAVQLRVIADLFVLCWKCLHCLGLSTVPSCLPAGLSSCHSCSFCSAEYASFVVTECTTKEAWWHVIGAHGDSCCWCLQQAEISTLSLPCCWRRPRWCIDLWWCLFSAFFLHSLCFCIGWCVAVLGIYPISCHSGSDDGNLLLHSASFDTVIGTVLGIDTCLYLFCSSFMMFSLWKHCGSTIRPMEVRVWKCWKYCLTCYLLQPSEVTYLTLTSHTWLLTLHYDYWYCLLGSVFYTADMWLLTPPRLYFLSIFVKCHSVQSWYFLLETWSVVIWWLRDMSWPCVHYSLFCVPINQWLTVFCSCLKQWYREIYLLCVWRLINVARKCNLAVCLYRLASIFIRKQIYSAIVSA